MAIFPIIATISADHEAQHRLDRTDVALAYAYVLGREDGLPYVFVDMDTLPKAEQDDRFDDVQAFHKVPQFLAWVFRAV